MDNQIHLHDHQSGQHLSETIERSIVAFMPLSPDGDSVNDEHKRRPIRAICAMLPWTVGITEVIRMESQGTSDGKPPLLIILFSLP